MCMAAVAVGRGNQPGCTRQSFCFKPPAEPNPSSGTAAPVGNAGGVAGRVQHRDAVGAVIVKGHCAGAPRRRDGAHSNGARAGHRATHAVGVDRRHLDGHDPRDVVARKGIKRHSELARAVCGVAGGRAVMKAVRQVWQGAARSGRSASCKDVDSAQLSSACSSMNTTPQQARTQPLLLHLRARSPPTPLTLPGLHIWADGRLLQPHLRGAASRGILSPVHPAVTGLRGIRCEGDLDTGDAAGSLHRWRLGAAHRDGVAGGRLGAGAVVVHGAHAAAGQGRRDERSVWLSGSRMPSLAEHQHSLCPGSRMSSADKAPSPTAAWHSAPPSCPPFLLAPLPPPLT